MKDVRHKKNTKGEKLNQHGQLPQIYCMPTNIYRFSESLKCPSNKLSVFFLGWIYAFKCKFLAIFKIGILSTRCKRHMNMMQLSKTFHSLDVTLFSK